MFRVEKNSRYGSSEWRVMVKSPEIISHLEYCEILTNDVLP